MKFNQRRDRIDIDLPDAVKALRAHLGDSQQAFATRLGLSIRSIANYEKDRKPEAPALAILAKSASDAGRLDLTGTFMSALGKDLELSDISGFVMSYSPSKQRGYLLLQFDGQEKFPYVESFAAAMTQIRPENPRGHAYEKAERLLKQFVEDLGVYK